MSKCQKNDQGFTVMLRLLYNFKEEGNQISHLKTFIMELSKVLLGALLLGIAVETSSCVKEDKLKVTPVAAKGCPDGGVIHNDDPCPACGMG